MQTPFHPLIVHFPIALTFIMPALILVIAYMIKANKMSPSSWIVIIGLQLTLVVTGYIALESGETDEDIVEKVVSKKLIHAHEEAAEIFVGSTVLVLALSIAVFFIRKDVGYKIKIGILFLSLISCFLVFRAGELGGELVYSHGAASAYTETNQESLLPTPNMNTSESALPAEDNESLKPDENDYGSADESDLVEEESRQED